MSDTLPDGLEIEREPEDVVRPVACFLEALESHLQRTPPGQEQVQVVVTGIELDQVETVLHQRYPDRPKSKWILTTVMDHVENGSSGILVILRRNSEGRNTSVAD